MYVVTSSKEVVLRGIYLYVCLFICQQFGVKLLIGTGQNFGSHLWLHLDLGVFKKNSSTLRDGAFFYNFVHICGKGDRISLEKKVGYLSGSGLWMQFSLAF